MAVEKAIIFDDLQKGDDDERREGFFRGGRSRRGGLRGGKRSGSRGKRSGRMGSVRGARSRAAKASRAKSSKQGVSRRGTTTTSKAVSKAAAAKTASKTQGQTRRGTTTTAAAVSRAVADKQNKMGTKYAGNLQKAIADANKRAFDRSLEGRKLAAAQANVTAAAQNPNLRAGTLAGDLATRAEISRMDTLRGNLLEKAKRNQITNPELSRLADMNRAIGLNPTTGMGLVESMRFNTKDINLGDLARVAGLVTNPIGTIASAALTGGQGILGTLKGAGQTALAALTGQPQQPRSGGLGSFMDRFKNITIGPPAPTPPDRGRREPRPDAFIPPQVTPIRDPNAIPVTGKPVTDRMLNEYLALAGFSPQEIRGMPAAFRFLD